MTSQWPCWIGRSKCKEGWCLFLGLEFTEVVIDLFLKRKGIGQLAGACQLRQRLTKWTVKTWKTKQEHTEKIDSFQWSSQLRYARWYYTGLCITIIFFIEEVHHGLSRLERPGCSCDREASPANGENPEHILQRLQSVLGLGKTTPTNLHHHSVVFIDQAHQILNGHTNLRWNDVKPNGLLVQRRVILELQPRAVDVFDGAIAQILDLI